MVTKSRGSQSEQPSPDAFLPGVFFEVDIESPKERVQAFLDAYQTDNDHPNGIPETFDMSIMKDKLRIASASKTPKCVVTFELKVDDSLCNRTGSLHGGAAALLLDMCTTMAMAPIARKDFWHFGGVSRNMSITYLRPIRNRMEITIECEVMQVGKTLATIHMKITRKGDGALLCVGEHNKAWVDVHKRGLRL